MSDLLDAPADAPAGRAAAGATRPAVPADRYAAQARRRARRVDGLVIAAWALGATAVALFLADNGQRYFTTVAGATKGIGILAGLVSAVAMCLMLVLVARVPVIDRAIGQDRATSLHATFGKVMVSGIVAHACFLVSGYALGASVSPWTTVTQLWAESTDFRWALAAGAGFVVVGLSSAVAVRRRYPYEVWHAIHLTTYAAIAASIPHQFSMSGILAPGTVGRVFWIGLWLAVAFCLLAFRIVLPLLTTVRHDIRVARVLPEGPDAVSIEMTGRDLDRLGATGGQWLTWRFLTPGLALQPHPFSLSAAPSSTSMRVTVRSLGAGTARLAALRPGTRVAVEGPYGLFTDAARTRESVVLVGAGIGIAPVRALLEATTFAPGRGVVVLRASRPDELYLDDEVAELCRAKGAYLYVVTGHRAGDSWVSRDAAGTRLVDYAPFLLDADLYVCGPTAWADSVIADAEAEGLPRAQVHVEHFAW